MMPLLSAMNQSSVTVDNPPNDETGSSDKAGSYSSIQIRVSAMNPKNLTLTDLYYYLARSTEHQNQER
jgi:hypothetical protein